MFPRKTNDLVPEAAQKAGMSEEDAKTVINVFFKDFIPDKIRSIDTPYFGISNFGDYRISPYEALTRLKKIKSIIERLEQQEKISMSQEKIDNYYIERDKLELNLSKLTKIYGKEYMEEKFGERFTEAQIPDFRGTKEQLVKKRRN